jgi:2-aminoadipate transaminase
MNYQTLLSDRTAQMGASAIREILKVVAQPGMVSLAGGIPSPQSFPLDLIQKLCVTVIEKYGAAALQYGPTEGFSPLRQVLAKHLGTLGMKAEPKDVLVSSGSQGVLDALGKVLISKGDQIAVETPTYLGALQAFDPYQPCYVSVETDDDGIIPEALERKLKTGRIKFVYLVPTFQNPTGRSLSIERRHETAAIIKKYEALLVEDDPYSTLRYHGQQLPTLKSLAPDNVVYIGTFSKIFAPGLRVGFCLAPTAIGHWLTIVKQGVDLHTSTLSQALAAEYLAGGYLEKHLPSIINLYRPRQAAMLSALENHFANDFHFSRPQGGMFIWVEGPPGFDAKKAYQKAIQQKVAFVPGCYFYADPGAGLNTMRLNFSMNDPATIEKAVTTLADVVMF